VRKYAGPCLPEHKICSKCGWHKLLADFSKDKSTLDGLCSQCKGCRGEYAAQWNADNPRDRREYNVRRYAENPDRYKEDSARRREENPEYMTQWAAENPDKIRAYSSRRRALKLDAFVEDVNITILMIRDGLWCYYCSKLMEFEWKPGIYQPDYAEIEHKVPLSKGGEHSYDNCVLACTECNGEKGVMTYTEFIEKNRGEKK
jgi:5-methylcytosine-specific restriction endonuclease McrA